METRVLGRTGLTVSRIGIGLAALGRPGYINVRHGEDLAGRTEAAAMEENTHRVLDRAYAHGIRYFDAARSYGKAEEFLASWLASRGLDPTDVTVGSKWGYTYTADWRVDVDQHEVKDLSATNLRRQSGESRALLGDHLRLYQIHSATLESGVLDDEEVREELDRFRSEGVAIGFSVTGARQAETIERALERGGFDTVQATWNLLEPSAGQALELAHAAGLGVIVKEALANGRLTERGDVARVQAEGRRRGTTPDVLALAACLAQPWADVVLSGPATGEQLESNLGVLQVRYEGGLDDLAEEPGAYWTHRATLPWN